MPYELELKYEEEAKEILGGEKEMVAAEMTNMYQARMWQAENNKAIEIAKKMLKMNLDEEIIIKTTELNKEEIEKIKKEL